MIAVSLFDYTGNMLRPWLDAGYECHIFDIQHPPGGPTMKNGMHCHGMDLSKSSDILHALSYITGVRGEPIEFISCFPPCTHLAVSGARWFRGKGLRALQESISYFATCVEVVGEVDACPFLIENPMSTISTYWREPDHKFHPCHYSGYVNGEENYTKETWLWTGGGFVMPPKKMAGDLFDMPDTKYIHHQPPGEERANIRSATPMGFAQAVFEANQDSRYLPGTDFSYERTRQVYGQ